MNYVDEVASLIKNEVDRDDLPDEKTVVLFRMYAVLLLAKGEAVTLEDVHNAWSAWICSIDPDHTALVPFNELPATLAEHDAPYVAAIRKIAQQRG